MYRKKYEISLGWVRIEPTPATTTVSSHSVRRHNHCSTTLVKNKFHGIVLCLISLNDLSDRAYFWCASALIIYKELFGSTGYWSLETLLYLNKLQQRIPAQDHYWCKYFRKQCIERNMKYHWAEWDSNPRRLRRQRLATRVRRHNHCTTTLFKTYYQAVSLINLPCPPEDSDLSFRWAHMPFCWFCHALAHFVFPTSHLILLVGWIVSSCFLLR